MGHEVFYDQWMVAYDYDLLQDPRAFEKKIKECIETIAVTMRGPMLKLDERLTDFILGMLAVDPNKRYAQKTDCPCSSKATPSSVLSPLGVQLHYAADADGSLMPL